MDGPPSPAEPGPQDASRTAGASIASSLKGSRRVAATGVYLMLSALGRTMRRQIAASEPYLHLQKHDPGPLILALWHGQMLCPLLYYRDRGAGAAVSQSGDGRVIAAVMERLGYRIASGSSSRGGARALRGLARLIEQGHDVALTVDGPRGPRNDPKSGVVQLARLTGRPILPVAGTATAYWRFQSWDRFRLPLPFSKMVIGCTEGLHVARDADDAAVEAARVELRRRLLEAQAMTDEAARPWVLRTPDRRPRDGRKLRWRDRDLYGKYVG